MIAPTRAPAAQGSPAPAAPASPSARLSQVELEFKRIQTYLFASPRLRAMLGANATLGHTVRIKLPSLALECGACAHSEAARHWPAANPDDPLQAAAGCAAATLVDDPQRVYREFGVLVRDGGHFSATFPQREAAERFVQQARAQIAEALPGILVQAKIDGSAYDAHQGGQPALPGLSLYQHPAFQLSHHMANRPAAQRNTKGAFVSADEIEMEKRGKDFRAEPSDLIGLLEKHAGLPLTDEPPQSLADLAEGGYVALLHIDGNGVGKRYSDWKELDNKDKDKDKKKETGTLEALLREAHGERFFHSMRVVVRRALCAALKQCFAKADSDDADTAKKPRYQLLMLGGDDLLLVCAASYALPFVCAYARALQELKLCDGEPLAIGAGVAIAHQSFPFYRLHSMAEALADSAKRRSRAAPELGSVVDWHISANAWVEDPIEERRNDSLCRSKVPGAEPSAVLSAKPYPVLGAYGLEALLEHTDMLIQHPSIARSQLRQLVELMRQGPHMAELAWLELPPKMREALEIGLRALAQGASPTATHQAAPASAGRAADAVLWLPTPAGAPRLSLLPDLVELYEIARRRNKPNKDTAQEPAPCTASN